MSHAEAGRFGIVERMTAPGVTIVSNEAPLLGASPGAAMLRFVGLAFRLRGRASRSEYWWWMLINVLVIGTCQFFLPWLLTGRVPNPSLLVGPFGSAVFADIPLFSTSLNEPANNAFVAALLVVSGIWILLTAVPGFTVAVRRLHDSNLSGWWVLLVLIGWSLVMFLLALRRSRPEGARFDAPYGERF